MQDGPRLLVAAALGKIIEPLLQQALPEATVRIAEDRAAVERAFSDRLRYDVVVIDLTWMDYAVEYSFDGLDVLDMLRRTRRQTPVIFAAQGHGPERDGKFKSICLTVFPSNNRTVRATPVRCLAWTLP